VFFFTSMGGRFRSFLLLPLEASVLEFTTPSVSATNFAHNIVVIPGRVYRCAREGRMAWPLAWRGIPGTVPGGFLGYCPRVLQSLPGPRSFNLFMGFVLLCVGGWLVCETARGSRRGPGEEPGPGGEGPGGAEPWRARGPQDLPSLAARSRKRW